jgi:flavorubredoxin
VGQIEETLRAMKVELVAEGIKSVYVPDQAALSQCFSLGRSVAEKLKEKGQIS